MRLFFAAELLKQEIDSVEEKISNLNPDFDANHKMMEDLLEKKLKALREELRYIKVNVP